MYGQLLITGFVLGAVSSFHCVGMCGPIAFSLPVHYLPKSQKALGIFLYNLGRIVTYSLLGLLFGFVGRQIYLGGMQQGFSVFLGALILFTLLGSLLPKKLFRVRWAEKFTQALQRFIARYMQQRKLYGMFVLGAANGLLPCGMVYFAITGALAAGTIDGGVLFMAAFGFGTLPAMFALSFFGSMIGMAARNTMKKAVPYVLFTMGILLILRGLNLNIPYISPYLHNHSQDGISCH
ncbi:MAG: sulfite exporter TauE/SafE family protein [Bacteroidetes bacterium]|nr:sulfite exporter TauE/SafE family protein [Bacteroidota bacterium]